jgi:hypothetical protein
MQAWSLDDKTFGDTVPHFSIPLPTCFTRAGLVGYLTLFLQMITCRKDLFGVLFRILTSKAVWKLALSVHVLRMLF